MSRRPKSAVRAGADAKKRVPGDSAKPVSGAEPEGTDLRDEIAHALAQLKALETEQTEFRATFERAKAASGAERHALQSRIEQAEKENGELAAALEATYALHAEIATLRDAHEAAATEAAAAREALAGLQTRHTQAVQKITDLERELTITTAQAQADRLAAAKRTDDLALQAQDLARTLDSQQREAERRFDELSARHEDVSGKLAHAGERLTLAREELARASETAMQARARSDALAAEILARDELCAALRHESNERQFQIAVSKSARAMIEERLRIAERRIAEADHARAVSDLRWQAWQGSVAGRFGVLLSRAGRRWSAVKHMFTRTSPNPLFDEAFYLAGNPDVTISGTDPYRHYLNHGAREGRDPHPLFATAWYLKSNPDVAASGVNPLVHFYETGAAQSRDPHPDFSTRAWREAHPEAAASGVNPLEHVLRKKHKP